MKFRMILLGPDDPEGRPSREAEARGHRRKTISYEQHEGGMVRLEGPESGTVRCTALTNFHARIVGEIISDDGAEQRRTMRLEAEVAGKTVSFVLQPSDFNRMNWVLRELGPKAIVYPGQQQHARAAIQSLSNEIQPERVFAHLGWARNEQSWVYLQPGQIIGALVPDLKVCLADPLKHYYAPPPTDPQALTTAIRCSLRLLTVAPDRVTIPLLAAVYRAPLGLADFAVFLTGRTGTYKTALAALCQQHFGAAMNAAHLPANFAWTGCALEEIAFQAKDSLVVIDDFVPTGRITDGALQGLVGANLPSSRQSPGTKPDERARIARVTAASGFASRDWGSGPTGPQCSRPLVRDRGGTGRHRPSEADSLPIGRGSGMFRFRNGRIPGLGCAPV